MKHAPQARFDRWKDVPLVQIPSTYTPDQMHGWTETDWNWHMREALKIQGFRVFHIREASETGIADLIVYNKIEFPLTVPGQGRELQVISAWLELKANNVKTVPHIRPAQVQFMRDHWRIGRNALFVMYDRTVRMLAIHQGDLKGRVKMLPQSPYATRWQEVFDHFKTRRVSI